MSPKIKIYEALGAFSDGRYEFSSTNEMKVYSSSRNKSYTVVYSPDEHSISANDNGSYWKGYLGYPSILFLIVKKIIEVPKLEIVAGYLKNYAWKDINQKFKNDFTKTENYIREDLQKKGDDLKLLDQVIGEISVQIEKLRLSKLKSNLKPPKGY